jgi:hypothetical protein
MTKHHKHTHKENRMALRQQRETERPAAASPVLLVGSRRPSKQEVDRDAEEFAPYMNISGRTSRNLIARQTKAK